MVQPYQQHRNKATSTDDNVRILQKSLLKQPDLQKTTSR